MVQEAIRIWLCDGCGRTNFTSPPCKKCGGSIRVERPSTYSNSPILTPEQILEIVKTYNCGAIYNPHIPSFIPDGYIEIRYDSISTSIQIYTTLSEQLIAQGYYIWCVTSTFMQIKRLNEQ